MHTRFLVTLPIDLAEDPTEAKGTVEEMLCEEGFICCDGCCEYDEQEDDTETCSNRDTNYFGCGQSDWFVMGGRWSGELSHHSWFKKIEKKVKDIKAQGKMLCGGDWWEHSTNKDEPPTTKALRDMLKQRIERLYAETQPKKYGGKLKYYRNDTGDSTFEDDAMVLNKTLYDNLLKQYEKRPNIEQYFDLKDRTNTPSRRYIGKRWLVVIDYHY